MSSFIIVVPPWNVLVDRFGYSEDIPSTIASEDEKMNFAWSDIEEKMQLTAARELIVYPPKQLGDYYYYLHNGSGEAVSLTLSFLQFCVDYREKPIFGVSKPLIGI